MGVCDLRATGAKLDVVLLIIPMRRRPGAVGGPLFGGKNVWAACGGIRFSEVLAERYFQSFLSALRRVYTLLLHK